MNPKMFFPSNLRYLREQQRKSQEELAFALGITRNKLQALESGKTLNPTIADLFRISEYFHLTIDQILRLDLRRIGLFKLRELQGHPPVKVVFK